MRRSLLSGQSEDFLLAGSCTAGNKGAQQKERPTTQRAGFPPSAKCRESRLGPPPAVLRAIAERRCSKGARGTRHGPARDWLHTTAAAEANSNYAKSNTKQEHRLEFTRRDDGKSQGRRHEPAESKR